MPCHSGAQTAAEQSSVTRPTRRVRGAGARSSQGETRRSREETFDTFPSTMLVQMPAEIRINVADVGENHMHQ